MRNRKHLLYVIKPSKRTQLGFTMVEFMVALAITAILLVGTLVVLRHLVVVSADNAERTIARLQVQYVNLWLNEDVVQAQSIYFGNTTGSGFPLVIEWADSDSETKTVTYWMEDIDGESGLGNLLRAYKVGSEDYVTSLVAESLEIETTKCYRKTVYNQQSQEYGTVDVLILEVTAIVDRSEASSFYEIHPRARVAWEWGTG